MSKNILKEALKKSFLFKLTFRTSLFLFSFLIVLFTFYLSGNYQGFQSSTQLFILFLCSFDSIALFLFGISGLLECLVLFFISEKKKYWIFFAFFFFLVLISTVMFFLVRTISILTKGTY